MIRWLLDNDDEIRGVGICQRRARSRKFLGIESIRSDIGQLANLTLENRRLTKSIYITRMNESGSGWRGR